MRCSSAGKSAESSGSGNKNRIGRRDFIFIMGEREKKWGGWGWRGIKKRETEEKGRTKNLDYEAE